MTVRGTRIGGDRAGDRPRPRHPGGGARAHVRAVPARRAAAGQPGAGLGLAIARGFAEANGGRLWAESRAGQGATFALALPTDRRRAACVSGARVLVVDDEPQILRALRTSLRGAGYEVETAATAEAALAEAAMRPPDAVILDLVLPDGTGTDVCRELRTGARRRSSSCRRSATSARRSPRWTPAPTTTSPSRSASTSCWRGCGPRCAEPPGRRAVIQIGELVVDLEQRLVTRRTAARCT